MPEFSIAVDDPRSADIRALLGAHHAFAHDHSPPEDVHALDVDGLVDPTITFVSCRMGGQLLGVGALKELEEGHAELKSMHTAVAARGRGVARAILDHLIERARDNRITRLSLETGSMDAFAPARALYERAGFESCGPFGDYLASPYSTFMTRRLA